MPVIRLSAGELVLCHFPQSVRRMEITPKPKSVKPSLAISLIWAFRGLLSGKEKASMTPLVDLVASLTALRGRGLPIACSKLAIQTFPLMYSKLTVR